VEEAVYILCTLTAFACSYLLLRGYWRTRARLLLWCGVSFLLLTLENAILFVDLILLPVEVDLSMLRNSIALIGASVLVYGLVWETK
jgi:hypothetical protein